MSGGEIQLIVSTLANEGPAVAGMVALARASRPILGAYFDGWANRVKRIHERKALEESGIDPFSPTVISQRAQELYGLNLPPSEIAKMERRDKNRLSIFGRAARILSQPTESPSLPASSASEEAEEIDEDFFWKASDAFQDCSNESLQEIWAQLVANACKNPGSVTHRSVSALREFGSVETRALRHVASLASRRQGVRGEYIYLFTDNSGPVYDYRRAFEGSGANSDLLTLALNLDLLQMATHDVMREEMLYLPHPDYPFYRRDLNVPGAGPYAGYVLFVGQSATRSIWVPLPLGLYEGSTIIAWSLTLLGRELVRITQEEPNEQYLSFLQTTCRGLDVSQHIVTPPPPILF